LASARETAVKASTVGTSAATTSRPDNGLIAQITTQSMADVIPAPSTRNVFPATSSMAAVAV
jgi:hypothetical protein